MTKFLNNADIKGYIAQTAVTSYLLKADSAGRLVAAIVGTDYVAPSALNAYLLLSGGTLTGALSGTTASFSGQITAGTTLSLNGGTLVGNNIVSMRSNPTGGQFRIEKSDGSLSAYPFYVGVDGTALAYYYNAAGALKVLLHTDNTSYFGNSLSVGYATYATTSYMLDVNGTVRFTGLLTGTSATFRTALLKGDATDGGILTITRRYSTGAQTINFDNNHPTSNLDWTGARITSADAGNYNGYLDFAVSLGNNGSEAAGTAAVASVMRLTKDKRVGINTTSPSKSLHVYTTDNEGIFLQGTGGGVWMNIQSAAGNLWSIGAQNDGMGVYNRTSSLYSFFIKDNRQVQFTGYQTSTSYTGTAAGYLAFDSSGNILTVAGVAGTDNTKLPLTGGTLTGPLTITGNGSYLGDWGYKTLELNDTSGYAGIFFKNGANVWITRRNGADNAMDWAYSTNATSQGVGTFTQKMRLATDEWWVSTYTGYKVQILSGDQINVTNAGAATTLYLQYQLGNGGPVNIAAGKYTFSTAGLAVFNGTGIANSPNLRINTSSSATFIHTQENFAANITAGQHAMIFFGRDGSTKNAGGIGYYWAGAGSNSNFITLGHWGNDDLLRVYGDGLVMATTNFAVGSQQGFDNPGGWNKNILIDGTNHGRFRIKASNYTYGNIDVALWADSSVSPSHGISGSNAVFAFNGSITSLTVGGNTVIHAANIGSYTAGAVAWANITAGTRSNYNLVFQPNANDYAGLTFTGANGAGSGYLLIRGTSDSDIYTANGVTLVSDQSWLTLAQRTSTTGGIRFMTGATATTKMEISNGGTVSINGTLSAGQGIFGTTGGATDQGIQIRYQNYVSGYGRIRFYQSDSNHMTIHAFSDSWQGGGFGTGNSAGAINIAGGAGVTFGSWNSCDAYIATGGAGWFRTSVTAQNYFYASGSIRLGDMWNSTGGLYRPSGIMAFGTENEGWRFTMANDQKAYIGTDGNIWMKWSGEYISTTLGRKAVHRGEGENYVDYSRYVYNNGAYSGSGWIEPSDLGVRYASSAGSASSATYLPTAYVGGVQGNPQVYFNYSIGLKVAMTGAWSVWSDTMWINGYAGGDVPWMCALHFLRNSEPRFAISAQTRDSGGYGSYYEVITDYNIGSRTVGTANNLSGFDKTNPSFGAVYASNWFRVQGDCGLYSQDYGGHLRRNTYSYGNWEIFGYAKNGYAGIVTINNYVTAQMHNSSGDFGFLTENGAWWNLFYNNGNNCWGIGTDNTYSGDGFRCIKYGSSQYGWTTWSDRRAKENISTIKGALDTVLNMRGVYFNYITDEAKNKRVGFIAQELELVLPEAVRYAEEIDEYNVEYAQIVSVLAEAMKEQQNIIVNQNSKIERLELLVNQLIKR